MPGEEEARGVGVAQGGKWNLTPAGGVDGDRLLLADEWLVTNAGEGGSCRSPSAMEGDTRLLEDELPLLFCFDREVTGLLDDQNRLQEASTMGKVVEVGIDLWVVGDGIWSNWGTQTGQDGGLLSPQRERDREREKKKVQSNAMDKSVSCNEQ